MSNRSVSAFNIDYRSDLHRLHLATGEMLIETATDPVRPLIVDTPQGHLHALSTRFTVWLEESESPGGVEGAVRTHTTTGANIIVNAGQQIYYTHEDFSLPITADPARAAWAQGILLAQDIPLKQVVDELRRYRKDYLGIAPEVADLLIFGSFPLHDSDQTLAMLESVLPIRIQHTCHGGSLSNPAFLLFHPALIRYNYFQSINMSRDGLLSTGQRLCV